MQAALAGAPGIALGNVVGSNIANILLILGVSALILPLAVNPASFQRDSLAMGGSALLCTGAVLLGTIAWPAGLVLTACLVGYIWWAYRSESAAPAAPRPSAMPTRPPSARCRPIPARWCSAA
ncbi:MAG: hypothetical protein KatS3mg120_0638 [Erythrobacter sp.]|nr:MAG: hypothetical protein KatS3mg120_0638 [Erythrobacter sp.]